MTKYTTYFNVSTFAESLHHKNVNMTIFQSTFL